jgi:hypothetical protein
MTSFQPSQPQNSDEWLPLVDYSVQTGLSLSTLRRHIKAGKVEFRIDQGRYLLRRTSFSTPGTLPGFDRPHALEPNANLLAQLQQAREEIAELKMLVAIYEEQLNRLTSKSRIGNV